MAACSLSSPCSRRVTIDLDRDHGVVDQQAESDDQGAERDPLQVDAERTSSP